MKRTLDEFNTEWYEKQAKGQLKEEDIGVVPDIYLRNLELDEQVKTYQTEVRPFVLVEIARALRW